MVNFPLMLTGLALLAAGWIVASLLHRVSVSHEDDHLHFREEEARLVAAQANIAHRIDVLDKWRKLLLTAVLVYGLVILALYLKQIWDAQSSTVIMG